jgi:hypothetical protein
VSRQTDKPRKSRYDLPASRKLRGVKMDKTTREAIVVAGALAALDGLRITVTGLSIETLLSTGVKLEEMRRVIAAELVRRNFSAPV